MAGGKFSREKINATLHEPDKDIEESRQIGA